MCFYYIWANEVWDVYRFHSSVIPLHSGHMLPMKVSTIERVNNDISLTLDHNYQNCCTPFLAAAGQLSILGSGAVAVPYCYQSAKMSGIEIWVTIVLQR